MTREIGTDRPKTTVHTIREMKEYLRDRNVPVRL